MNDGGSYRLLLCTRGLPSLIRLCAKHLGVRRLDAALVFALDLTPWGFAPPGFSSSVLSESGVEPPHSKVPSALSCGISRPFEVKTGLSKSPATLASRRGSSFS
jgi:hypothetical protein